MIIFLSIFLTIFISLHYYVFYRLYSYFGIQRSWHFYLAIVLLAGSYPLASFLEHTIPTIVSQILTYAASVWMGALFFSFWIVLLSEFFRKVDPKTKGLAVLIIVLLLVVGSSINALFIRTKTVNLQIDGLKEDVRLVQLSDLHIGSIYGERFLNSVVQKVNAADPDIVVITGDLYDSTRESTLKVLSSLNDIKAPVFFITGNHETYSGPVALKHLEKLDLKVLKDEAVDIKGVQLVGIDYPERGGKKIDLSKIPVKSPSILLYHDPSLVEEARSAGADLYLCGHTHNGQIIPFNLFVRLMFRYLKGLYNHEGMHVYVSPGTGTWGPPMRLGSINEITVLNLKP